MKLSPGSAGETDLPLSTHTAYMQIKYQYAGQSLTKAKPLKEMVQKCYMQHTTQKKYQ